MNIIAIFSHGISLKKKKTYWQREVLNLRRLYQSTTLLRTRPSCKCCRALAYTKRNIINLNIFFHLEAQTEEIYGAKVDVSICLVAGRLPFG